MMARLMPLVMRSTRLSAEPDAVDLAAAVALAREEQALAVGGPHRALFGRGMIGQSNRRSIRRRS